MKTILLATDFSVTATNAANYAADMAEAIKAKLVLLHVYQFPMVATDIPVVTDVEAEMLQKETALLHLKKDLLKRTAGSVDIDTITIQGSFFTTLKEQCEKSHPYSVVMGSQGTTAAERLLLGGHTVYAMKHLHWPLVTVPKQASFNGIKKIGLACDLQHVPDTVPADELVILRKDFNAELHVLNTGDKQDFDPQAVFESGELQRMLGGVIPHFHFLAGKDIDREIMDFADQKNIDLLVVFPRRHGILHNILHRSHTKIFVLHSYVPVMAMHAATT